MKTLRIPHTDLHVSRIALGCMQLGGSWDEAPLRESERTRARRLITVAAEQGINLCDHADVSTQGKSDTVFGDVLQRMHGLGKRIVVHTQGSEGMRGQKGSASTVGPREATKHK